MPDCGTLDFGCKAAEAVQSAIEDLASKVLEAVAETVASLGTFWITTSSPDVAGSDAVSFIRGSLTYYVAAAAVLSVIVAGARMAWEQRSQPGLDLVRSLGILIGIGGASTAGITLALSASDALAQWLIEGSTDDFGAGMATLLSFSTSGAGMAVILLILLGLVALIASLLQMALLVIRNGFLVVLAGTLPLAASASNTQAGRAWLTRSVGWLVAFVLYKPAAGVIYATAFQVVGDTGEGLVGALTGITLMIMALLALPALLKLTAPLVSAAAGGSGGGAVAGLAAAAVPTGAAMVGRRGAAPASGGPAPTPPGAPGTPGAAGASGAAGISGGRAPGSPGPAGSSAPSGTPGPRGPGSSGAARGAAGGAGAGVGLLTRGKDAAQSLGDEAAGTSDGDSGAPRGTR